jgi:DNA ligase (NAD+)
MNSKIEIPTHCPCCNSKLELIKDQLFCRNKACGAQILKKIEHFCKALGIKGMGSKTLEKLDLSDITELYQLNKDKVASTLGSTKIAQKLLQEINDSKQASLNQVLISFSIPLFGNTASQKLCSVVNHIDEINYETCKQAGLGDKVTNNLLTWLETEFYKIRKTLPFTYYVEQTVKTNNIINNICITGKLSSFKTKTQAYQILQQFGYTIVESVTKTTNYLVDEENKSSTKRKKAEQLGIKIITDLQTFLREHTNG